MGTMTGDFNVEKYWKQFQNCLQYEKPFCSNVCPFHVDVLDFQAKMARKNYSAAYKNVQECRGLSRYRRGALPGILRVPSVREKIRIKAVQLNLLEKTCVEQGHKKGSPRL